LAGNRTLLWGRNLNGPLYVPDEGREVLTFLALGGPGRFVGELQRLSAQGSPWAAAVLAYNSLIPVRSANVEIAAQLCRAHAEAGDPYACFVLGWALFYAGDHWRAVRYMRSAMAAGFRPAMVDFARFAWNGVSTGRRDPETALKAIRAAHQAGHKGALLTRCVFYVSGRLGVGRRVVGYLLYPVATLRYLVAICSDPFSSAVFNFQKDAVRPLFKTPS
jgi:hypothetical protein